MAASAADRIRRSVVLSIGDLTRQSGVPASTIRYYEHIGLLPDPERESGRRRYQADMLIRLAVIKLARETGFALDEIKLLLAGPDPGHVRWRELAEAKLLELDAAITRLKGMRQLLEQTRACGCLDLEECELVLDRLHASSG